MSADNIKVNKHEQYSKLGVVSPMETANTCHRKGSKSSRMSTTMVEIRNGEVKTRKVSGDCKH